MLTALPPSAPLYLARRNPPKKISEESSELIFGGILRTGENVQRSRVITQKMKYYIDSIDSS